MSQANLTRDIQGNSDKKLLEIVRDLSKQLDQLTKEIKKLNDNMKG